MNIPKNGRIAIVDDNFKEALPLIKVLSKNRLPYTYYPGNDMKYLPEEDTQNDIRILFLDINLLDGSSNPKDKNLKGPLHQVLSRVVSKNNLPYIIVLWSKHEDRIPILDELFNNELKDRKPIKCLNFIKSEYFPILSNETIEVEGYLLGKLNDIINNIHAHSYLQHWENLIHTAANSTLQEIFEPFKEEVWENNANCIIERLSRACSGKYYEGQEPVDKIIGAYSTLNSVFTDSLESLSYTDKVENPVDLVCNEQKASGKIDIINQKINVSGFVTSPEPGEFVEYIDNNVNFGEILNEITIKPAKDGISEEEFKRNKLEYNRIKEEIKSNWKQIAIIVTPVCDHVLHKNRGFHRLIAGIMINVECRKYIHNSVSSEAVYEIPLTICLPNNPAKFTMFLDFRYFITRKLVRVNDSGEEGNFKPLGLRFRRELLAEIQSRLARHINRQGILTLQK